MLEEWLRGKGVANENKDGGWWSNRPISKYIMIGAVCLGLLALIWPMGGSSSSVANREVSAAKADSGSFKSEMIANLEGILSQVDGAGQVEVSISLASDGLKSYASNSRDENREITEGGSPAGSRLTSEETKVRDLAVSSGNPLLVENKTPEVLGVLVVADGANLPEVAERLLEATATLLNISPHQVSVMPREKQ